MSEKVWSWDEAFTVPDGLKRDIVRLQNATADALYYSRGGIELSKRCVTACSNSPALAATTATLVVTHAMPAFSAIVP